MENGIIQLSQMKRDENYLCYFVTTPKWAIFMRIKNYAELYLQYPQYLQSTGIIIG